MTARNLRQTLTEIQDQDLTIRELRALLFNLEDQDRELTLADLLALAPEKR